MEADRVTAVNPEGNKLEEDCIHQGACSLRLNYADNLSKSTCEKCKKLHSLLSLLCALKKH